MLVVDYVRRLEEALIAVLAEYGLRTGRIRGRSGVWLAADDQRIERKIAAIGVRVAAGTTMHGFALNVDPDLRWFDRIIPCGLTDVGVTSMAAELGRPLALTEVARRSVRTCGATWPLRTTSSRRISVRHRIPPRTGCSWRGLTRSGRPPGLAGVPS